MKKIFLSALFLLTANILFSQKFLNKNKQANKWVDSVFNSLNEDEKIAQLFIIRAHSNLGNHHIEDVINKIKKYNVGGLCFFQGGPVRQANLTNYYQSIAKTPLLITMDAEWGLGMRLDSVNLFPKNMMLGAMQSDSLILQIGKAIGKQCKRMGIHLNYAPVVDVNNNPENPVINDRSFGENKYKVSNYANQLTNGMQSEGVMACAKHFPGHGDVAVDSHLDLPVINKSLKTLNSLELYPFKQQIKNNVGCIMTAHLSVPAIDTTQHLPTSLSKKTITNLLKNKLGFKGLIITDGLEMKALTKYFPSGESSAQAIIAGNDLLCLPEQIDSSIFKIKEAITQHKLSKKQLYASVKKVLLAKYNLGLNKTQSINTKNLTEDLNKQTNNLIALVAENAITTVKQTNKNVIPLNDVTKPKDVLPRVALIHIGNGKENEFTNRMKNDWNADVYFYSNSYSMNYVIRDSIEPRTGTIISGTKAKYNLAQSIIDSCTNLKKYDAIIISVHQYNRRPANNFGLDTAAVFLMQQFAQNENAISFFFGNPYAIKNNCNAQNIIACYEDDAIIQHKAADLLQGRFKAVGKLPVTVCY
ncbi:MAG: glycoside hydrolase family 3 protein [Chitinophagaceae bacterium]